VFSLKARAKRGAIDFETIETLMLFDDEGKIEHRADARNDAHRLIEECMLAANVCASRVSQESKQPTLYRVHEGPTPKKLLKLRTFLGEFGFQLGGGDKPHAKDYAALLAADQGDDRTQLLQTVMLRSLRQAVYSPDNVGHFGLAYEAYTHFTSPIRRYPDLLVHRAIKAALRGEKRYEPGNWEDIGLHCSRPSGAPTKPVVTSQSWLKCYFMQDRLGENFDGVIASVVSFGIFVALDDVYVEGLVHVSDLGQDYYHFDAARHQMLGERTGTRYRLGDRVRVKVARVDLDSAKIDFVLADEAPHRRGAQIAANPPKSGTKPAATKTPVKKAAAKSAEKTAQGGKRK
jgi:ribonuclease R